jgi:hypothetical protein
VECAGGVAHSSLWIEGCSVIRIIHDNYPLVNTPTNRNLQIFIGAILTFLTTKIYGASKKIALENGLEHNMVKINLENPSRILNMSM